MIPYGKQHITPEDIKEVAKVLQSDFLTQGPVVLEFEKKFAEYIGSKYAVAVANGTAALHLSALALGVKKGVNVITTPITFAASANCVLYAGGNVFFADIDPSTQLLDIESVKSLLKSKDRNYFSGIIVVDFAGSPIDLEAYKKLADEYGFWIIEDAAHAPGGFFTDSKGGRQNCGNGNFADLAIFSFHPVKHIATGEGGMITTNNKNLYEKLLLLRTHGITKDPQKLLENHGGWYQEMQELGFNYRLTDIAAALGISQLNRASENLKRRREIAKKYAESFSKNKVIFTPLAVPGHAYHLFVITIPKRKGLYDYLKTEGILAQVHYLPVHLHPYYSQFGWKRGDFKVAEKYYEECLSLPMFPSLTDKEQDFVIEKVLEFFK